MINEVSTGGSRWSGALGAGYRINKTSMFVPNTWCLISIIFAIAYNHNLRLLLDFLTV